MDISIARRNLAILALAPAALAGCAAGTVEQPRLPLLPGADSALTRADHEEFAAWYDKEAQSAEERMVAHSLMRDLYVSPYPDYSVGTITMVGHCQNRVRQFEQAARANLALAQLHRRRAGLD